MIRFVLYASLFLSFFSCSSGKKEASVRLGWEASFFSTNEHTVRMKGFFDAVVPLLEKKMGTRIEVIQSSDDGVIDLLDRGIVNCIFSDVNKGVINEDRFQFSFPLMYNGYYLVTQKEDHRSLCDLQTKKVLIYNNSAASDFIACYPEIDFGFYTDEKDAFVQLSKTFCSALIVPVMNYPTFVSEFQVMPQKLTDQYYRFVAKKEDPQFAILLKALSALEKEGTLAKLKAQWMLEP